MIQNLQKREELTKKTKQKTKNNNNNKQTNKKTKNKNIFIEVLFVLPIDLDSNDAIFLLTILISLHT